MQKIKHYRLQKNMSLDYDDAVFIMRNHLIMSYSEMARQRPHLTFNKVIINAKLMGVQCKPVTKQIKIDNTPAKVIDFDNGKGYFDLSKWAKCCAL